MQTPDDIKQTQPSSFLEMDQDSKTAVFFLFLSFACHVAFFAALIYFQDFSFTRTMPPVIQVDLVSFSPDMLDDINDTGGKVTSKAGGAPPKAKPVEKAPEPVKHIQADISLKTKPKNVKELMDQQKQKEKEPEKKKEKEPVKELAKEPVKEPVKEAEKEAEKKSEQVANAQKEMEKARQDLEKRIEDQDREQIAEALRRLQKSVGGQGTGGQGKENGDQTENSFAGTGQKGYKAIDLYKLVLGSTIKQNWVYTDVLAGMDKDLEVRILIKILRSGEIRDIIYETKSGNRYLDESAKNTIKKSNPLPPLPAGMHSYDLVVIFTPQGLK